MATRKTTNNIENIAPVSSVNAKSDAAASTAKTTTSKRTAKKPVKNIPVLNSNDLVSVKNGFHGKLYYRDRTTGESYTWSAFGDEVDMTVGELKRARGSQPKFFEQNWWIIDDHDVIEALRLGRYYENALDEQGFEELFNLNPEEVSSVIAPLSDSQKRGVLIEARDRLESGELFDIRMIKAIEDALKVKLREE